VTNDKMQGWIDYPLYAMKNHTGTITPGAVGGSSDTAAPFYISQAWSIAGNGNASLRFGIPFGLGWTSIVNKVTWQIPANQAFTNEFYSPYFTSAGRTLGSLFTAHVITNNASDTMRTEYFTNYWPNDTAHRGVIYQINTPTSNQVRYVVGWQWKPLN